MELCILLLTIYLRRCLKGVINLGFLSEQGNIEGKNKEIIAEKTQGEEDKAQEQLIKNCYDFMQGELKKSEVIDIKNLKKAIDTAYKKLDSDIIDHLLKNKVE